MSVLNFSLGMAAPPVSRYSSFHALLYLEYRESQGFFYCPFSRATHRQPTACKKAKAANRTALPMKREKTIKGGRAGWGAAGGSPASLRCMCQWAGFCAKKKARRKRFNACGGLVPAVGLEPTRRRRQRILSPPRLPFRHAGKEQWDSETYYTGSGASFQVNFQKEQIKSEKGLTSPKNQI